MCSGTTCTWLLARGPDLAAAWSDEECRAIVRNRSPRRTTSATEEPDWGQSGSNWEQRVGCREIVDEQALLNCMVYVGLDPDRWAAAVDNFDEWLGREVVSVERLRELFDGSGDRWVNGMRNCRATFG